MAIADTFPGRSRGLSLRAQAEAIGHDGTLPPQLEQRYRDDTATERSRALRAKSTLSAFVYSALTLLLNAIVVYDPNWRNVAIQVVVTPCLGMLIAWRYHRATTPDATREAAALGASLIYTLSVIVAVYFNPPAAAAHDLLLIALPVNFVLVFIRLRFTASVVFVALSIAALTVSVALRHDLTADAKMFPIAFLAALSVPTLFVVQNHEQAARRSYLSTLLQRMRIEHLSAENQSLAKLSITDPLTGAANRRRLDRDLEAFCDGFPTRGAFLLIDLDGFKAFNDRHGHIAGDQCLKSVAACMAGQLRRCDLLARFGGEEFAVLLPDVTPHDALEAADRLRQAIENNRFVIQGQFAGVTVSIGVADAAACTDPAMLLGAADTALYSAKNRGRNRVCAAWEDGKLSFFEKKDQKTFFS